MRAAFPDIEGIVPISLSIFIAWGVWIIVYVLWSLSSIWIYLERFGNNWINAVIAGSLTTIPVYGLFWLALFLMNLAKVDVIAIALPLAWFELIVAALILSWRKEKFDRT